MTGVTTLGEARRRQEAAKHRGERFKVSGDVRAARVAMLEAREAKATEAEAQAKAEQEAAPTTLQAVLNRATLEELSEISRMISRLDGRRLQTLVDDVFRAKSRERITAPGREPRRQTKASTSLS